MNQNRERLREQLLSTDSEFKKLVDIHRSLDAESCKMSQNQTLTQLEKNKLQQVKRKKLLIKDQIERFITQAKQRQSS